VVIVVRAAANTVLMATIVAQEKFENHDNCNEPQ
jgi:hypothetical protein